MSPDQVRTNLRFAGEPMHRGESMAVVCVACTREQLDTLPSDVAARLRDCGTLQMHAHAATVSYRPVPRSTRDPLATGTLLAEQPLRAVMHCLELADSAGNTLETAFVRGSFWAVRIGGAR
jgi:hypothetical protein